MTSTLSQRLFEAVKSGQPVNSVQRLIESKANVDAVSNGWNVLHCAAAQPPPAPANSLSSPSPARVVVALLCAKANVNARSTKIGWTPLHYAAQFGNREAVRVLLSHVDIDANAVDWTGKRAADHAKDPGDGGSGSRNSGSSHSRLPRQQSTAEGVHPDTTASVEGEPPPQRCQSQQPQQPYSSPCLLYTSPSPRDRG